MILQIINSMHQSCFFFNTAFQQQYQNVSEFPGTNMAILVAVNNFKNAIGKIWIIRLAKYFGEFGSS